MREAKNHDEVVSSRLRSVLADHHGVPAEPGPPALRPFTDDRPVAWSDIIPSWPDDAEPAAVSAADDPAWDDSALGAPAAAAPALTGAGAFDSGAGRLAAFDPGRRGVRALAAVATVVVLIAAFLAWRARPRVDPVAVPPAVPTAEPDTAADGAAAGADPAAGAASASPAEVVVAVGGKVAKPGLVRLPAGARVADAVAAAGGARPGADVALLNLARKVVDGEHILVGVAPPPGAAPAAGQPAGTAPAGPVNLNTATLADLDTLPGVGPVLAQRILDARTAGGGFRAVSDLRKVEGIGAARYEQLKDLVTV